jgi:hypothetical protein
MQEVEAARARSEALKRRLGLEASIERLKVQQQALEEAQEARKATVKLELEKKVLEKEAALQVKRLCHQRALIMMDLSSS